MDQFKMVLPMNVSLTCDSWFGVKSWLEHHKSTPITLAMADTQGSGLWQLFSHNLKKYEYRTFTNNKFIITFFQDNNLMRTASTVFKIGDLNPSFKTPFEALETNVQPPSMQLSDSALKCLQSFPKEDLIKLATNLGKQTSK
jgi:hypothetical protein